MDKKPYFWYLIIIGFAIMAASCGTGNGDTESLQASSQLVDNVSNSVADENAELNEEQIIELVENIVEESQGSTLTEAEVEAIALRVFEDNFERLLAGEDLDFDLSCLCLELAEEAAEEETDTAAAATEEAEESTEADQERSTTTTTQASDEAEAATTTVAPVTTTAAPTTSTTEAPATTTPAQPPATTTAPTTTTTAAPIPTCTISYTGDPTRETADFRVSLNMIVGELFGWTVWSTNEPARDLERNGLGTTRLSWTPAASHAGERVWFGFGRHDATTGLIDPLCSVQIDVPAPPAPQQTTTTTTAPEPVHDCVVTPSKEVINVGESVSVTASNGTDQQQWIVFDNHENDHSTREGQTGRTINWLAWKNSDATSSGRTITFVAVGCRNAPNSDAYATVQVR